MAVYETPVLENKTDEQKTERQKEVEKKYGKVYDLELLEEDGIPLETFWHNIQMHMLINLVQFMWKDKDNFFVGGNMFIYYNYEQAKNLDYRGPDVFVVDNVDGKKYRPYWAVWEEEDRYPDVIIELASPTTISNDLGLKKDIYENIFQTEEYYCYNPDKQELLGWKLVEGRYEALKPNEDGWLYSEKLGVWLGLWEGRRQRVDAVWLRFFTRDKELVPTSEEYANKWAEEATKLAEEETRHAGAEAKRAEAEAKRAEAEAKRAETEAKRAETEAKRAEAENKRAQEEAKRAQEEAKRAQEETKRAQEAEAEVEKLRALLEKHGIKEDQ